MDTKCELLEHPIRIKILYDFVRMPTECHVNKQ